jgi:hypothetical protein
MLEDGLGPVIWLLVMALDQSNLGVEVLPEPVDAPQLLVAPRRQRASLNIALSLDHIKQREQQVLSLGDMPQEDQVAHVLQIGCVMFALEKPLLVHRSPPCVVRSALENERTPRGDSRKAIHIVRSS